MSIPILFEKNRNWARETEERTPGFFSRLQAQQSPQYLWIGCADSRVPANEVVGLAPGELFVHRNVANVVVHSDLNCLSVVQFAIEQIKVRHIMVVGHYGCSGVRAAMDNVRVGLADNWLRHVQDVRNKHQDWLDTLEGAADPQTRYDALCELNVIEQVSHVCSTTVVEEAWSKGQELRIHAWCYGLKDGLLNDLGFTARDPVDVRNGYDKAVAAVKLRYKGG